MHKIKNNPSENDDAVNKEYVDSKEKTISWAYYQALPEAEKKDGTTYFIPDMPVDTNGNVIGEVEYGTFILTNAITSIAVNDVIPIDKRLSGNIEYDNGYKLKKGKVYSINVNIGTYTGATTDNAHLRYILKFNSNQLAVNGISIPATSTSNWSDTQVSFIYTPSEDGTLTINCLSIENISGLLESLTNVSIVEIPSLQACIDVTDEHIKEVATTNLSKLQFAPFSDGWQMEIKHEQVGETDYIIIDSFKDDEILRYVLRQKTQTKEQSIAMLYSDDGGTTFKNSNNVCTTKVLDVPLTKLTIKDSDSVGNVYYQVKNGECTISGQQFRRTTATGVVNNVVLIEGLPKCSTTVPSAPILYFGEVKGQVWMSSNSTDLKIAVPTAVGDTGENCVFTIKYPVAES